MKKRKKASAMSESAEQMPKCVLEIENASIELLRVAEETKTEMDNYYPHLLDDNITASEVDGRSESLKRATANIAKALTHAYTVSDELSARWYDLKKQRKKRRLFSVPANSAIDLREISSEHFARGMNLYKLLLICFIGSFAGVVVELLWCLITNGYLESRSGLVYGPFNLLYGAGAVALTACLYRFRNRSSWISFAGGMIVGSVVEYVCSWGQELVFGSRSWDYSGMPFNINGRICLLYSVFWGVLGVFWIKTLYPLTAKLILKIPNKVGKIATWVLVVFFVFNAVMSCISVYRWSERIAGVEPTNTFWEMVDNRFPDERMERIFANMEFSDGT